MKPKTLRDVLLDANLGIVGIDDELNVYGGYDEQIYEAAAADRTAGSLPAAEKVALAEHMIALWQRYRDAAAPMKWSKIAPTITGWYWYRGPYAADSTELQPVVTYVSMSGELSGHATDPKPHAWQPFLDYDCTLEDFTGEWYGPIPYPPA